MCFPSSRRGALMMAGKTSEAFRLLPKQYQEYYCTRLETRADRCSPWHSLPRFVCLNVRPTNVPTRNLIANRARMPPMAEETLKRTRCSRGGTISGAIPGGQSRWRPSGAHSQLSGSLSFDFVFVRVGVNEICKTLFRDSESTALRYSYPL